MPVRSPEDALKKDLLNGELRYVGSHSIFSKIRMQFTPDLHELNHRMWHVVFIPKKLGLPLGGMKRVFEERHTKYLGGAITVGNPYQMFTTELGQRFDQYIVSDKDTIKDSNLLQRGHVEGFALAVPTSVVCDMDLSYNHGYQTERQRRHVWLTAQKKDVPAVPAFFWTYKRDYLRKMGATTPVEKFIKYTGKNKQLQGENVFI